MDAITALMLAINYTDKHGGSGTPAELTFLSNDELDAILDEVEESDNNG